MSEETRDPEAAEPTAIERAAEEALADAPEAAGPAPAKRGRGRPRGSRTRDRRPARAEKAPPAPPEPPPPPSPAEVAGVAALVGTAWRVIGGLLRRRPLLESEQLELATAAIPVLQKYGAGVDRWAAELNLGLVVYGLWVMTEIPKPKEVTDGNENGSAAERN